MSERNDIMRRRKKKKKMKKTRKWRWRKRIIDIHSRHRESPITL